MNMIMIYNTLMNVKEMLSNSNRLPVKNSKIYEPDLLISFIVYGINTPEFEAYLDEKAQLLSYAGAFKEEANITKPEILELTSDPISACQFHVIEVKIYFLLSIEKM